MKFLFKRLEVYSAAIFFFICTVSLQTVAQIDSAKEPQLNLPMPGMGGILKPNSRPNSYKTGVLGTLYVTGIASGIGQWQNTITPGDHEWLADVSNAQIMIQKTDGFIQYYLQLGGYSIPDIGIPYIPANTIIKEFFGFVPEVFLKLAPTKNFSFLVGKLPTLIGTEYTFSFENMNVQRGLLWNQENDVNRGIQANYNKGQVSLSLTWNDGFYSQKYTWLWGSLTYTINTNNSLSITGGGNTKHINISNVVTPLYQNNEQIYGLSYTHNSGKWTMVPYLQYTHVPVMKEFGVDEAASTTGAAMYINYSCKDNADGSSINLPIRLEYIGSSGSFDHGPNLLYGSGSKAWSITITPTYQYRRFFARPELSIVKAIDYSPGAVFGSDGNNSNQVRVLIEAGFIF